MIANFKIMSVGILMSSALAIGAADTAQAQFSPDILSLSDETRLAFPPSTAFDISEGGTIEFWVQSDWNDDPGYDPTILSSIGNGSALYNVTILGDRSGLAVQSGDNIGFVAFDFATPEMSHVAIVDLTDSIAVMINGRVEGILDFPLSLGTSDGLWIGSADGTQSPFNGAIANLRFWDVALDRGDLVKYSTLPLDNPDDMHPDIESLVAVSDFENQTIEIFQPTDLEE